MTQQALIERDEHGSMVSPQDRLAQTVQALALNANVDVGKLKELIELQRGLLAEQAEAAFDAALSRAQSEIQRVAPDAYNSQTKSRYPSYAALDRALRPIYTRHGFSLSFDTDESPREDHIRIVCLITHTGGHRGRRHLDMPADGKGAKGGDVMTKTHAAGSAVSYGMRYLLKMVFNVAVGEDDDDGNRAGAEQPAVPAGYQDWLTDLEATADNGVEALEAAWKASKPAFRNHRINYQRAEHTALKKKAEQVGKGAA